MNRNRNPEGSCFYCGKPIYYQDHSCAFCGKENTGWIEPSENQCGNCHAPLGDGDKYCRICGTKVGDGAYDPYQDLMECIYGPMSEERRHACRKCGYTWTTYLMLDRQQYCPKCGGPAPYQDRFGMHPIPNSDIVIAPTPITLTLEISTSKQECEITGKATILVGRSTACDVVFSSLENARYKYISGIHAKFQYIDGSWYIEDNDSKNGTWVNGNRLSSGVLTQLSVGDNINLAQSEIMNSELSGIAKRNRPNMANGSGDCG